MKEAKLDAVSVTDSTRNGSRVPGSSWGGVGGEREFVRKSCVMHVNSVEGRGWLGNKVDRCDGLSEISTEATSQVEQFCICSGT